MKLVSGSEDRKSDHGKLRLAAFLRIPVGNNQEIVYCLRTRAAHLLTSSTVQFLARFSGRKHVDLGLNSIIGAQVPKEQRSALKTAVREWKARGLLEAEEVILERLNERGAESPKIETVAIVTRDRPAMLERALRSFASNIAQAGTPRKLVLVDDSRDRRLGAQQKALLAEVGLRYGLPVVYWGIEEKIALVKALTGLGLPGEILEFALLGDPECNISTGANRNSLLLETIDSIALSADDDTICSLVRSPDYREATLLASGTDPRASVYYEGRESALASTEFTEQGVCQIHEELLGRRVGTVLSNSEVEFGDVDSMFLHRLSSQATLRITQLGVIGDPGTESPVAVLFSEGPSHQSITSSFSSFRRAMTSREVLRASPSKAVYDGTAFGAWNIGLDHRRLLPPFMPAQRGQDSVFATIVQECFPDTYFGLLPWAVFHCPDAPRSFTATDLMRTARGVRTCHVLMECACSYSFFPGHGDPEERLIRLGRHMDELARLPSPDFEEFIQMRLWRRASSFMSYIDYRLSDIGGTSPDFWRKQVSSYAEAVRRSLVKPYYVVPYDLGASRTRARRLIQKLVGRYGQLLRLWPAIVSARRELKARGQ